MRILRKRQDEKMKKTLLVIAVLCGAAIFAPAYLQAQTPAQPWGYTPNPSIIDATNLIHAIENGMEMYEQLNGIYQTIKTNVERLKQMIKDFESFDLRQLSLKDPLGSWRKIMTYGDRMMTYEENIESILNKKDIKIGAASYSLSDLYMINPVTNVKNMAGGAIDYVINDPFEKQLTLDEKAVFHQKYGMSYGHYIRYHKIGEWLSKKAAEVTAYNMKLQDELTADREAIQSVLEEQGDGSWVREQQKVNSLLMAKNQELKTKSKLIADIADIYAKNAAIKNMETKAAREDNEADFGENYLKILEKTENKNDYKGHLYPF